MEANGRIIIPPPNATYSVSELWFIHRNLPAVVDNTTDFQLVSGYARIHEQVMTRKCSFRQVDQDTLGKMNIKQYPALHGGNSRG